MPLPVRGPSKETFEMFQSVSTERVPVALTRPPVTFVARLIPIGLWLVYVVIATEMSQNERFQALPSTRMPSPLFRVTLRLATVGFWQPMQRRPKVEYWIDKFWTEEGAKATPAKVTPSHSPSTGVLSLTSNRTGEAPVPLTSSRPRIVRFWFASNSSQQPASMTSVSVAEIVIVSSIR